MDRSRASSATPRRRRFARPEEPIRPIPDRPPDTRFPAACRAQSNKSIVGRPIGLKNQPTKERMNGSTPSGHPLFREQSYLRLELLDAAREILDQLALGIGKESVIENVAGIGLCA